MIFALCKYYIDILGNIVVIILKFILYVRIKKGVHVLKFIVLGNVSSMARRTCQDKE